MYQMSLGDAIIAVALALQLVILAMVGMPSRQPLWKRVLVTVIMIIGYELMHVFSYLEGEFFYQLGFMLDLFLPLICVAIICTGNLWRNYVISIVGFQLSNFILSVLSLIFEQDDALLDIALWIPLEVQGALQLSIMAIVSTVIVGFIIKVFVPREYHGNGNIYMVLAILLIIGFALAYYLMVADTMSLMDMTLYEVRYLLLSVLNTFLIAICYYLAEKRRLKKEEAQLQSMIVENYDQYEKIVKANQELKEVRESVLEQGRYAGALAERTANQELGVYAKEALQVAEDMIGVPLSGNPLVDAVFSKYNRIAKEKGILVDIMPEPMSTTCAEEKEIIMLLEYVFHYVFMVQEKVEGERWIVFRMKKRENSWVLKVLFSRPLMERTRLDKNQMLDLKKKSKRSILRIMQKLVKNADGTISLQPRKEEAELNILLPQKEGEGTSVSEEKICIKCR